MSEPNPILRTVLRDVEVAPDGGGRFRVRASLGHLALESLVAAEAFGIVFAIALLLLARFGSSPGVEGWLWTASEALVVMVLAAVLPVFLAPAFLPFSYLHSRRYSTQDPSTALRFGVVLGATLPSCLWAASHIPQTSGTWWGACAVATALVASEAAVTRRSPGAV